MEEEEFSLKGELQALLWLAKQLPVGSGPLEEALVAGSLQERLQLLIDVVD